MASNWFNISGDYANDVGSGWNWSPNNPLILGLGGKLPISLATRGDNPPDCRSMVILDEEMAGQAGHGLDIRQC